MRIPSIPLSPVRAMGGLPVASRNSSNKVVSNHIQLIGNKHRTLLDPEDRPARICRHGNPLAIEGDLEVAAGVVNPDAAPARPKTTININDNYYLLSPEPKARPANYVSDVQRQNFHVLVQQPVLCPVVSPVPFVLNVRGQPQRKGGSPSSKVNREINFVKSAFSVDQCVFAPTVTSVHNVANAQLIGGGGGGGGGGGASAKFLAGMGPPGCKSESGIHLKGRLHSPFQDQTSLGEKSPDSQRLCKPPQEPLPQGGFASLTTKGGNRDGEGSNISSLLQQTIHSPQTKPQMASHPGPQCTKQIFERKNIQDGNPRDNSVFLTSRGMGNIAGFQRRLFPHSSSCQVPEISQAPFSKSVLPVPGSALWPLNSSDGVHLHGKGGETNGSVQGYKDPPVPRRLVGSSPYQRILPPRHPIPPRPLSGIGLGSEHAKVGIGTQTGLRVCGLQVRSLSGPGQTDSEPVGVSSTEDPINSSSTFLQSQGLYVFNRPSDSNRKAGTTGTSPHEANPVASQKTLENSGISGESPKVSSPALTMVDQRDQCLTRSTPAPPTSCHSNLYRRLKRRLGCSLRRLYNKGRLVNTRKPPSHKLPRAKSGLAGLKKVPAPCAREGSADCHRQYHCCGIHQQGGRYDVRLTLCPSLAAPVLVQPEAGCSQGQTHSWSPQCDCRQVVTSRPDNPNRIVSSAGGVQPFGSNLAPSPRGHVCNKVQLQVSPIRVSSSGPQCLGSGCTDSQLREPGHVHVSPRVVTGQGSQQTVGPSVQEGHIDRSRVAQHTMVLGTGGSVISDPSLPTQSSRPSDTTIQQGLSQGSDQPKPSCLAPRAEAIKEQGFSSPVAT